MNGLFIIVLSWKLLQCPARLKKVFDASDLPLAPLKRAYEKFSAIWYHLYNLKNMKNTYGGVLLLVEK